MEDLDVATRVKQLTDEEHDLFERGGDRGGLAESEHDRLRTIETELDQCYDLLRQRRARRRAGLDPDDAKVRDVATVEKYIG